MDLHTGWQKSKYSKQSRDNNPIQFNYYKNDHPHLNISTHTLVYSIHRKIKRKITRSFYTQISLHKHIL